MHRSQSTIRKFSLMLSLQEFQSLDLIKAPAAAAMVFQHKAGKGLSNHHTHLRWLVGLDAVLSARALVDDNIGIAPEHQIASHRLGDDLLQIAQRDVMIDGNDSPREFRCEHLAVAAISHPSADS